MAAVIVTVLVVVAVAGLRLVAGDLTPTTAASRAMNVDIIHTTARAVEGQAARAMIVVAGLLSCLDCVVLFVSDHC